MHHTLNIAVMESDATACFCCFCWLAFFLESCRFLAFLPILLFAAVGLGCRGNVAIINFNTRHCRCIHCSHRCRCCLRRCCRCCLRRRRRRSSACSTPPSQPSRGRSDHGCKMRKAHALHKTLQKCTRVLHSCRRSVSVEQVCWMAGSLF